MKMPKFTRACVLMTTAALIFTASALSFLLIENKDDADRGSPDNHIIEQGLSIVMDIEPVATAEHDAKLLQEGDDALLKLTVRDASSDEPVKGLHPALWMVRQDPQQKVPSCREQINSYLQGRLAVQPEINLNSYFILVLNDKASISVIDPLNGFGGSKLITRIMLNSPGEDWALSKDHKKLYVATPLSQEVAVIDTAVWKVLAFLPFDAAPKRLALQPDGRYLWIGFDAVDGDQSFAGVVTVDTEKDAVAKTIQTGTGRHDIAFSDDSRFAYVSNAKDSTITIIDTVKLAVTKAVKTDSAPVSLAFSELSKALYVASEGGQLLTIDTSSQVISANTNLGVELKKLRFGNDGRWGFVLSRNGNKVFVIDSADNRLIHSIHIPGAPDQIAFSDAFAYVHSSASATVSMIQLDGIGKKDSLPVTAFPAGQKAPGATASDAIAPTPERSAVAVANPADKSVYYYMEGMAAPMGSFENFGLAPMAVMVIDRSLRESPPGVYASTTQLPPAGVYSAAILLDTPPVFHCFAVNINPNSKTAKPTRQSAIVEYAINGKDVVAGSTIQVKLKLNNLDNAEIKKPLTDLQVLIFRIPGLWQRRLLTRAINGDTYQIDVTLPEAGVYQIFTQSPSLQLNYERQPPFTFQVGKAQTTIAVSGKP